MRERTNREAPILQQTASLLHLQLHQIRLLMIASISVLIFAAASATHAALISGDLQTIPNQKPLTVDPSFISRSLAYCADSFRTAVLLTIIGGALGWHARVRAERILIYRLCHDTRPNAHESVVVG